MYDVKFRKSGLFSSNSRSSIRLASGHSSSQILVKSRKHHPFVIWLIFAGLVYSGSALLYGISRDFNPSVFDVFFLPLVLGFSILCYVCSILVLTKKRWTFIFSAVVSLGFVIPSLSQFVPTLQNPSNFITYAINLTTVPILILTAVFSILAFMQYKKGLETRKNLATPISMGGIVTAIIVVILIAGVAIGYADASQAAAQNDPGVTVYILLGANDPNNPLGYFSAQNLTVVIGINNTITWVNQDYSVHTITGQSFSSGLLNSGDMWTYTFTTPGTYPYHCSIHPYMTGTVIVKSS